MNERPLPEGRLQELPRSIVIRRAEADDAGVLADMRVASHLERHPDDVPSDVARFRQTCLDFFSGELSAPASFLTAWIAWDSERAERAVGTAGLTVLPTLPRPNEYGAMLDARVRNVYVIPQGRRLGVARALLLALTSDVADHGIRRLTLGTSTMARPLYERLGFVPKGDEMILDLRPRDNVMRALGVNVPGG